MKTVYVQQLLKVLLEEYEDIDFMLETLAAEKPNKRDSEKIRRLLARLSDQNHQLQAKFPAR